MRGEHCHSQSSAGATHLFSDNRGVLRGAEHEQNYQWDPKGKDLLDFYTRLYEYKL